VPKRCQSNTSLQEKSRDIAPHDRGRQYSQPSGKSLRL
jgi:hypothetical protein